MLLLFLIRPTLLLERDDQRVCFSLACTPPSSDLLVASFRPKADPSRDAAPSQAYPSQTQTPSGSGKLGQHTVVTRTGSGMSFAEGITCYSNVNEVRLGRSAVIPYGDNQHLFAYGDESLCGVQTWQLPSFGPHSALPAHREQIFDLRYAESPAGAGYLGCLRDQKLQVFRVTR
jgi:E3 ubiquitin-protein ligase RFWD3